MSPERTATISRRSMCARDQRTCASSRRNRGVVKRYPRRAHVPAAGKVSSKADPHVQELPPESGVSKWCLLRDAARRAPQSFLQELWLKRAADDRIIRILGRWVSSSPKSEDAVGLNPGFHVAQTPPRSSLAIRPRPPSAPAPGPIGRDQRRASTAALRGSPTATSPALLLSGTISPPGRAADSVEAAADTRPPLL